MRAVPHVHLKQPPLKALRSRITNRGGETFDPYPYDMEEDGEQGPLPTPRPDFHFSQGENMAAAFCQVAVGILLSHNCELDKDNKHRLVALIRPLSGVQEKDRETIKEGRNFSYLYLPAYGDLLSESYVDFRRITTVAPEFLKDARRIVCLTETALAYLYTQFFRYLTRRDLNPEVLNKLAELEGGGE